jgi:hypothetical protein
MEREENTVTTDKKQTSDTLALVIGFRQLTFPSLVTGNPVMNEQYVHIRVGSIDSLLLIHYSELYMRYNHCISVASINILGEPSVTNCENRFLT